MSKKDRESYTACPVEDLLDTLKKVVDEYGNIPIVADDGNSEQFWDIAGADLFTAKSDDSNVLVLKLGKIQGRKMH